MKHGESLMAVEKRTQTQEICDTSMMPGGVPAWRVTPGERSGAWSLVPIGSLKIITGSKQIRHADRDYQMWSPSVESYFREDCIGSGSAGPPSNRVSPPKRGVAEKRDSTPQKENMQLHASSMGQSANGSGKPVKGTSSKERGILTSNSGAVNGSISEAKRLKLFETPLSEQSDFPPLFQTASTKSITISSFAVAKAKALLGFDAVSPLEKDGREFSNPGDTLSNSITSRNCLDGPRRPHMDEAIAGSDGRQLNRAPECMFRTATGRSVSVSSVAMNRARALLGEEASFCLNARQSQASSGVFENSTSVPDISLQRRDNEAPHRSFFQTGTGRSVSVSSAALKQAAKPLEQEHVSDAKEASSIKFITGGGRPVSVSSRAIKRARDLLGGDVENMDMPPISGNMVEGSGLSSQGSQCCFETATGQLITVSNGSIQRAKMLLKETGSINYGSVGESLQLKVNSAEELPSCRDLKRTLPSGPLKRAIVTTITKESPTIRKRVASFKAPRRLQFSTPQVTTSRCTEGPLQHSDHTALHLKQGVSELVKLNSLHRGGKERKSLERFFNKKPHQEQDMGYLTREVRIMTAESAKRYRLSVDALRPEHGLESVGSDDFRQLLLEAGAIPQLATTDWVDNHYRWILWKLACLERSYPNQAGGKFLTVQTVFDELRHRYEKEINCGHRSALKRITEGDAAVGSMMILCVAAIVDHRHLDRLYEPENTVLDGSPDTKAESFDKYTGSKIPEAVQIEVTDGWYSLMATVDRPLVRQLNAGKIFVGQKLRVCGATFAGFTDHMQPLEAFQVMKLALHINGTYRAHWAEKLGIRKGLAMPLAFHCIKHDGGLVPRTIIGIDRIYPVLYCERLPNGGLVSRSTRAEEWAMRAYIDSRAMVAEEVVVQTERQNRTDFFDKDMEEGKRLFNILENSAEPELLMADMTAAQHAAFSDYQLKREAARQASVEKSISKALKDAHLNTRNVTPVLKVSIMGLKATRDGETATKSPNLDLQNLTKSTKGIVTIWQVAEEQISHLQEGGIYCVSGLIPLIGRSQSRNRDVPQFRATRSTRWKRLSQAIFSSFSPRRALHISSLGAIPFCSEFDVAVLVVYVGEPYTRGCQRRQWLFASDGSTEKDCSTDSPEIISILVIDVSTSSDAFLPVDMSIQGCIMGYCNLIKRHRDHQNYLWIAEAAESSTYSSNLNMVQFSHLKAAADDVNRWAKASRQVVEDLRQRIRDILAEVSGDP